MRRLVERAEQIASSGAASGNMRARTQRLDRVLSGKVSGPLLMVLLLTGVLDTPLEFLRGGLTDALEAIGAGRSSFCTIFPFRSAA